MDGEEKVLLCIGVAKSVPRAVAAGSEQRNCGICGEPVFVSPSGLKFIEEEADLRLVCLDCAIVENPNLKFDRTVPGSQAEIADHLHVDKSRVEAMTDYFKQFPIREIPIVEE